MALVFRPTTPDELEPLAAFFNKHFKVDDTAPVVNREGMRWKFWEPRPDWEGSRSYVLASGTKWLSHVAACPMPMDTATGVVTGALLVDWVSASPGAGAEGFRRCYQLMDTVWGQGGSPSARATMLNLGFRTAGEVTHFGRPLHPDLSRGVLRFGRDVIRRQLPLVRVPSTWTGEAVSRFDSGHEPVTGPRPAGFTQTTRSAELLNYLLRCPLAKVTAHLIRREREPFGYFLLSRLASGTLLADLRLRSEEPADWARALAIAVETARDKTDSRNFLVISSLPLLDGAARANYLRPFMTEPIFLHDPSGKLAAVGPLHITPMDGDQGYL